VSDTIDRRQDLWEGADTQAEREASESGTRVRAEEAHQFGSVFWITVAISVAFVLWGVLFTENFTSTLQWVVGGITYGLG
jgi:hypothetical protein